MMLSKLFSFTFAVLLVIVVVVAAFASAESSPRKIKGRKAPFDINKRALKIGSGQPLPTTFDWRDHGFTNPVGNQNQCGGGTVAWTMANLISGVDLVTNKLQNSVPLSANQLVECSDVEDGCCGGTPDETIQNLIQNTGGYIATAASYPWSTNTSNGTPGACRASGWTVGAKVTNWVNVANNEVLIQEYLYKNGPTAITIDPTGLQTYSGGILSGAGCTFSYYEHMLLLTGWSLRYDPAQGKNVPIWNAMNSWGLEWGENGYVALQRGVNCSGLAGYSRSVTVAKK